ncbi:hypothetical protein HDZ31DRAFT_69767 [Schizophyllum fasciatum]
MSPANRLTSSQTLTDLGPSPQEFVHALADRGIKDTRADLLPHLHIVRHRSSLDSHDAPIRQLFAKLFLRRLQEYLLRPGHPQATADIIPPEKFTSEKGDTTARARVFLAGMSDSEFPPVGAWTVEFTMYSALHAPEPNDTLNIHTCFLKADVFLTRPMLDLLLAPHDASGGPFDDWLHRRLFLSIGQYGGEVTV